MKVTIEKIIPHGKGLARVNGKVLFVDGALPGEVLEVDIINEKKDYSEGRIQAIEKPSEYRTAAPCPYYGICGGCDFQHVSFAGQRIMKQQIMKDAMERIFSKKWLYADTPAEEIPFYQGNAWNYRRRVRIHLEKGKGLGFLERNSTRLVTVKDCPVAHPDFARYFAEQRVDELLNYSAGSDADSAHQAAGFAGDGGISFDDTPTYIHAEDLRGRVKKLHVDGRVFFQSNTDLLAPLVSMVTEPVSCDLEKLWNVSHAAADQDSGEKGAEATAAERRSPGTAVDLYSGVGLFSAFLEDRYEKVAAVEQDKKCLRLAETNTSERTQYVTQSVESWSRRKKPFRGISRLVLDPPRTGIDKYSLKRICGWGPQEIAYVSCSPVTFARDTARLASQGYVMKKFAGFDMYPQTTHIEVCGIFVRENVPK
ncbi:MAG: TRAM domain-containing protein [Spirochaetales bacterium]|nr:TRAM domain-containing protein [Spirochaetales bacterium]